MKKQRIEITQLPISVFKRWSRKPFGVFSSLQRVVHIGVITGMLTLLSSTEKTYAQTDTIKINNHLNLEEVVVSANRTQQFNTEISRTMTLIPAKEINYSAVQSMNELLKAVPGIDIRQRGTQGIQVDISLRGGSFEQTLILINGIPFNDPQTGHHNLNLPINLESIERIEVLYGPGARIYGPNAFTGAVNLITNSQMQNNIQVQTSLGQHGLFDANLSSQIQFKKTNHYLSFGTKNSDGYTSNTDFKLYQLFYRTLLNTKPGTFSFQAGYLNKAFGAQNFYTLDFPEQFEQLRQINAALGFQKSTEKIKIESHFYAKQNHDRFELFREDTYNFQNGFFVNQTNDTAKYTPGIYEPWNYYKNHNYHMTRTAGTKLNLVYQSNWGQSALGFDYRFEQIFSNTLGNPGDTLNAPGETRGVFTKTAKRTHLNLFAEHSYSIVLWNVTAGFLLHHNTDYGTKFNGGIELSHKLANNSRIFASVNQAIRLPSFTDLYYNGPRNTGNPELKPEESISYELGAKSFKTNLNWHAAAFYRQTTEAIDWIKYPSETKYRTENFSELNTWGTDLYFKWTPNNKSLSFLNYIQASYSFASVSLSKQDSMVSAYALDFLKHKITTSAKLYLFKNTGLNINTSYNARNGSYEDINKQTINYRPYILADLRLFYEMKKSQIYFDANNLFNNKYNDLGGIEQAGLWIKAGIKVNLNL
ncbi:MAG: hypothetical protein CVU09_10445 [Bacteroidetes bacterium HGW-Bacteroidetes-4]|jgi:iron complex outermembrane receptor protein|nr:MAG: hypothetical protein CVU09_10445 [Bacteroidetes bacterium HGW-Bacteroidetes-4]